ncbi:hypothetical protein [Streptomyces sp. NPDC088812]|uniref:hypothetical protein n=1 Tax=Streptomyces sp. NPDC088812 TaxID=3365905 RepID=UPI0037F5AF64
MQDGDATRAEEAGEWLRKNLKDKPEPKVDIRWTQRQEPDDAGFARFLAALFTPLPDGPEA